MLQTYSNGRRVFYGSLWSVYTLVLTIMTISGLAEGSILVALVCLVLGILAARYAYRIWTWQAKRLWLLILF